MSLFLVNYSPALFKIIAMLSSEFHSLNLRGALFLVGPAEGSKENPGHRMTGLKIPALVLKDMIYFPSVKVCLQMDGQIRI